MAQKVGSLIVSLGLESGAFRSGLSLSEKELKASVKRMQALGESMKSFGQTMSLAVTIPFAALAKSSIEAAIQSKDALAQVQQGIQSMGNAAGRSAEQLQALAGKEMANSLYDDDDILRQVTANLLTFGNVTGDTFDRAQQAAIDLSSRLGQDLKSSAIQVGKALNDPVKGVTALQRVGVSFTQQQREQIKAMVDAGNAAGAQKLILDELAKEFGGSAAAAAKANPFTVLKHAMDDFKEAVGAQLLQALPAITGALTGLLKAFNSLSPGAQKVIVTIGILAAVLGPVLMVIGSIVSITSGLTGAMVLIGTSIGGLTGLLTALTAGFSGLIAVLSPILIPLGLIAAAVFAAYEAWKHWDEIKAFVGRVAAAISTWWTGNVKPILTAVGTAVMNVTKFFYDMGVNVGSTISRLGGALREWLIVKLDAIWKWVGDKIDVVKKAFFGLYDAVVGHSYIPDMVDGIALEMARLDAVMVTPAKKATDRVKQEFEKLQQDIRALMADLFPESEALNKYRSDAATIDKAQAAGSISAATAEEARRRLALKNMTDPGSGTPGWLDSPPELVKPVDLQAMNDAITGVKRAANDNASAIESMNGRVKKSFHDMAMDTIGSLRNLVGAIQGGGFLDILQGVLGVIEQLGSIGVFGKTISGNINSGGSVGGFNPVLSFRAAGGPVDPWKPYVVGEKGPELFVPGAGGRIVPNHALSGGGGGAMKIQVEASPYFDVRVNGQIAQAAPNIIDGSSQVTRQQISASQYRSLAR